MNRVKQTPFVRVQFSGGQKEQPGHLAGVGTLFRSGSRNMPIWLAPLSVPDDTRQTATVRRTAGSEPLKPRSTNSRKRTRALRQPSLHRRFR